MINNSIDLKEINTITEQFFDVFTNKDGQKPNIDSLKNMFIPEGIIISNTDDNLQIYDLNSFIKPRLELLTNGTLTDFHEYEISHNTDIYKTIAHRFCSYEKSGVLNGEYFESKGMKTLQFVKVKGAWKLSSVAWSDEV